MGRILKFVLGQLKCVLNMCLCNKVPYILIKTYYYTLAIFWICVCLHMLCIKVYRKTSVGETHYDNKDEIQFGKQWTKNHAHQSWTKMGLRVGHPASYMGRPTHHSTTSPRASSTVRYEPNTLCFLYVSLSILNQIENPLINNFKT